MQKKMTVFLASSQEQYDKRIVSVLKDLLSNSEREITTWKDVALLGEYLLEALERAAKTCDAAIFVFGDDDLLRSRGTSNPATRDNVILEYGLFLGSLARSRVFILRERGVIVPSDLLGIQRVDYSVQSVDVRNELESCAAKISRMLDELGPRDESNINYYGIPEALRRYEESAVPVKDFLSGLVQSRVSRSPVHFDSYAAAIEVYRQGLSRVEERFMATSFVTSRFWVNEDTAFGLNHELLRRVKHRGKSIAMRRILLIEADPQTEVKNFGKNIRMLYRSGRDSDIEELWSQLQRAKGRHLNLGAEGCETRVARLESRRKRFRVGPMNFDLDDQEMAIYDSFRLDFYGGGSDGQIVDVNIYLQDVEGFEDALRRASQIFDDMWSSGVPIVDYFRDLRLEYESSMHRIDHDKNWIWDYNRNLPARDKDLKKREMEQARRIVEEFGIGREIQGHLDIGTCTGRYALEMRDLVAKLGWIRGIDIDRKCIEYINEEYRDLIDEDSRLRFSEADFLSEEFYVVVEKFDLITCMMGTISYFGYGRSDHSVGDVLAGALRKIYSLLTPGGIAVLSVWSESARRHLDLIPIYTEPDKKRLASWTPSTKALVEELERVGFRTSKSEISRLDIIACYKGDKA